MPKEYETPEIYIQKFEPEDVCSGPLFSGIGDIPLVYPTNSDGSQATE